MTESPEYVENKATKSRLLDKPRVAEAKLLWQSNDIREGNEGIEYRRF